MKTFFTLALMIFVVGCINFKQDEQIQSYEYKIDSLERVIVDKDADIDILLDDLEMREMEISWLGHSLDSLKNK